MKLQRVAAVAAAGAAAVALGTTAASAAPSAGGVAGSATTSKIVVGMYRGGFDAAVARANGYRVAYDHGVPYGTKPGWVLEHDAQGLPFAVPASAARAGAPIAASGGHAVPDSSGGGWAYANCGDSFIYFNAIGGLSGQVYTGFDLTTGPAVQVHWKVRVIDSAGTGIIDATPNKPSGTIASNPSWATRFTTHNHAGEASAEVYLGSYAVQASGNICYSEGPEDETRITD